MLEIVFQNGVENGDCGLENGDCGFENEASTVIKWSAIYSEVW